jgi:hypothetical protein
MKAISLIGTFVYSFTTGAGGGTRLIKLLFGHASHAFRADLKTLSQSNYLAVSQLLRDHMFYSGPVFGDDYISNPKHSICPVAFPLNPRQT